MSVLSRSERCQMSHCWNTQESEVHISMRYEKYEPLNIRMSCIMHVASGGAPAVAACSVKITWSAHAQYTGQYIMSTETKGGLEDQAGKARRAANLGTSKLHLRAVHLPTKQLVQRREAGQNDRLVSNLYAPAHMHHTPHHDYHLLMPCMQSDKAALG